MRISSCFLAGLVTLAASLCAGGTASSPAPLRLDSPAPTSLGTAPHWLQHEHDTGTQEHVQSVQPGSIELARQADAAPASPDEQAPAADSGSMTSSQKRRRCIYIGTFFHVIDCNAPVSSTQVPYAPVREPEQTTTATTRSVRAQVVSTGLVTRTRARAAATTTSAVEGG
ncbi:hypothetical protein JCM9279_000315 [Rhodotorula babjevae]